MKKIGRKFRTVPLFTVFTIILGAAAAAAPADDLAIWKEFVTAMKAGGLASDRVRPYYENLREPILGWLKLMSEKATWAEWEKAPETHRVGDHVHFLIPLSFDGQTANYCLTFITEGGAWFFRHIEAFTIRLDKTGPPPTSDFPDVEEKTKAHIREETHWSREVRVFNLLSELKGKDFAFDFFKDGDGYFLSAKTWVPFVEPWKAFILYACWEQANLRGNTVTLEKLDDDEALVRLSTYYFGLYKASAHLAQQVSFEDYTRIFETIWKDRARAAGWSLEIEYGNEGYPASTCLLRFKRPGVLKSVRLVVLDAGNPGPAKVGFHVEIQAGWHLYWINPGDAGLAPIARWTLPAGFTAGPLRHPVPTRSVEDGIISFEHRDELLLLCDISPPPTGWPAGPWKAAAGLEWMACRASCVTGETAVEAVIPPDAASLAAGRGLMEKFAARFPRPLSASGMAAGAARAEWTGPAWRVEVALSGPRAAGAREFFAYPVEDFVVDNAGVTCRDGKIVCPLIPSRGSGSPPPPVLAGVLIVDGVGYEISLPITVMRQLEAYPEPSRREELPIHIASWR